MSGVRSGLTQRVLLSFHWYALELHHISSCYKLISQIRNSCTLAGKNILVSQRQTVQIRFADASKKDKDGYWMGHNWHSFFCESDKRDEQNKMKTPLRAIYNCNLKLISGLDLYDLCFVGLENESFLQRWAFWVTSDFLFSGSDYWLRLREKIVSGKNRQEVKRWRCCDWSAARSSRWCMKLS